MQKILLIMAVILLSGSHAIASNLKPNQSSEQDMTGCHLVPTKPSSVNIIFNQDYLTNNDLSKDCGKTVIADAAPPDRGSPDTRGGSQPGRR